jgi:ribosomal protein L35
MFSHLARRSTENSLKIVPRAIQDAVKSRALTTITKRVVNLPRLGRVNCTNRSHLNSQSRSVYSLVKRPIINQTPEHMRSLLPCFSIICRGLKTRKTAAKRFIKTGTGELKYGHAGKRHNTSKKSKTRQRRLNQLVRFIPSPLTLLSSFLQYFQYYTTDI